LELQQKKATIRKGSYITAGVGRLYLSKRASVREQLSDYLAAATPAERLKILNEKHASAVADLSQRIEAVRVGLAAAVGLARQPGLSLDMG
jgi:hypothetical protein